MRSVFNEDRLFTAALFATAGALALYFFCLAGSLVFYTDPGSLASALTSPRIIAAMKLSVATATLSSCVALLVAIPAAFTFSRYNFPGKALVDTFLDLPIYLSPIAIGAMILVFFNTAPGSAVERNVFPFVFEPAGLMLAQFSVVVALAFRLLKSTFDGIEPRFEDVARTLGCGRTAAFVRVTLPLAKNGIIAAFVITWARAVGEFGATVTLAGATPFKTETLPVAIHLAFSSADVSKAVAAILILIAIAFVPLFAVRLFGLRRAA